MIQTERPASVFLPVSLAAARILEEVCQSMTGNSSSSTPMTPFPDPPSPGEPSAEDSMQPPAGREARPAGPDSTSADDLGLLLSEPDPMLGNETALDAQPSQASRDPEPRAGAASSDRQSSLDRLAEAGEVEALPLIDGNQPAVSLPLSSSENELVLPVRFSPCPDLDSRSASATSAIKARATEPAAEPDDAPGITWPRLLLTSYASAVTLALIWILWTGRGLPPRSAPQESSGDSRQLELRKAGPVRPENVPPPLPAKSLTVLGSAIRIGDLEVMPQQVAHRAIDLVRLDGTTGETRQVENVLVLNLRLANRSPDQPFSPLEPAFVRDSPQADDQSFIETADGRRVPMLRLATESEWSISEQVFPKLKPGQEAETVIVSEPVQPSELAQTLNWHVRLRTGAYQTEVLGVRFTAGDVRD